MSELAWSGCGGVVAIVKRLKRCERVAEVLIILGVLKIEAKHSVSREPLGFSFYHTFFSICSFFSFGGGGRWAVLQS